MKMIRFALPLASAGLLAGFAQTSARADTVYDSTPAWNGTSSVKTFGPLNTETYGEAVTAPNDGNDVLQSFTFYINNSSGHSFNLQGEVYAWDGAEASGPNLWQGALQTVNSQSGFQTLMFNTGGIPLTAGTQYALFASTSNGNQGQGSSTWGYESNLHPIAGSSFILKTTARIPLSGPAGLGIVSLFLANSLSRPTSAAATCRRHHFRHHFGVVQRCSG